MTLIDLLQILTETEIDALAKKTQTKSVYLKRCAKGYRKPSTDLCRLLVVADARLTLEELRPDVYEPPKQAAA